MPGGRRPGLRAFFDIDSRGLEHPILIMSNEQPEQDQEGGGGIVWSRQHSLQPVSYPSPARPPPSAPGGIAESRLGQRSGPDGMRSTIPIHESVEAEYQLWFGTRGLEGISHFKILN